MITDLFISFFTVKSLIFLIFTCRDFTSRLFHFVDFPGLIIIFSVVWFVFFRAASVRRESVRDPSQDTVMLTGLLYASLNKVQTFCFYYQGHS